jgi:hypothetical protein
VRVLEQAGLVTTEKAGARPAMPRRSAAAR